MSDKPLNLSFFKNKNILITGALGYIGSSVAKKLTQTSCHLSLFTRQTGDIADKNIWRNLLRNVDILFHFAAQTSSAFANKHPSLDYAVNVVPVINIIETCQKYGYSPAIFFAGTVTEAGMTKTGKINEKFSDKPVTIYDINKLTAEKYLQYYSNQLGREAVTLRLPNIYGPGPTSSKPDRGIVNLMIKKALKKEPITIFGNGKYIRDYLYIDDVVNAFLAAAINIEKTKGKYYVIGTGIGHTILQMAKIIQNQTKATITFVPFPEDTSIIEYRNFIADNAAFRKDTDWAANISLEEGIGKTIQYFKNII